MDLQNNQRRQRYVNDKGIEREVGVLRDFFGGAETHPKQKANKEQHDVVHCTFSERLPVAEIARRSSALRKNGHRCQIARRHSGRRRSETDREKPHRENRVAKEDRRIACRTSPLTVLKLRCSA